MEKIGLIQTHGIGDIIIALPIADFFVEQGCEVVWPVDERFVDFFQRAKPTVRFYPVKQGPDYFVNEPVSIINSHACSRTIILYSYLTNQLVYDLRLSASLKFDEYKYAIAGVPFSQKWDIKIERDMQRQTALFESLKIDGDYVLVHDIGSNMREPITIPASLTEGLRVVRIDKTTDDPFDWLLTMEHARRLVLLDSCFANLAEQLNLDNEKCLILRSRADFTPVYKNGWRFVYPQALSS